MTEALPWIGLAGLGAYHGVNPAMGWLFAVALGLQERSRRAVLSALVPIALGHEASIALVVLLAGGAQLLAAPALVRSIGATALIVFGAYKLVRPRSHPRWVSMRVTHRELGVWSFLMSTAHGAGLMLFPIVLRLPVAYAASAEDGLHASGEPHLHVFGGTVGGAVDLHWIALAQDGAAVVVHTLAMLVTMGVVALLVFERLGVGVLRRWWLNFGPPWALTLVVTGVVTLFT
jgi:hypothetical protein